MNRRVPFRDDTILTCLSDFLAIALEPLFHVDGDIVDVERPVFAISEHGNSHVVGRCYDEAFAIVDVEHMKQGGGAATPLVSLCVKANFRLRMPFIRFIFPDIRKVMAFSLAFSVVIGRALAVKGMNANAKSVSIFIIVICICSFLCLSFSHDGANIAKRMKMGTLFD